ncbi:MAG: putative sulfate exporter family transporter [Deltaproteobacteria bacterium]|nr:putative sulfate exporter family transporter [Deltaproteobacteria bacterium]
MTTSPSPTNPYENPALARWIDSYEGLPDWTDPAETPAERVARSSAGRRANELFALAGATLPGLALTALIAAAAFAGARGVGTSLLGFERSPVSPILVAILLGLGIRNTIGLPGVYEAGVRLGLKRVLRVGVALLGVQLSLGAAGAIGLVALPVVAACIAAALAFAAFVGRRLALPPRLATLIAVGTAICGNTAIVATAPVIGADDDETSYAVGCITVFGLLALLAYPFLSHALFGGDAARAGLFLGTAIHDTAQVAGAGLLYLQQYGERAALDTATVTKLVRNLCMLVVIPGVALLHQRSAAHGPGRRLDWHQALPGFVFVFVGLTALRTLGDLGERPFGLLAPETWHAGLDAAAWLSSACLTVAMASVGLGTHLARLRSLGLRPLAAGLWIALAVGAVSFAVIRLLEPLVGSWL